MSKIDHSDIGALTTQIKLTFHTKDVMKLIKGRPRDSIPEGEKLYPINGLDLFSTKVINIWNRIKQDDPYAELVLIEIERRLNNVHDTIDKSIKKTSKILQNVPEGIVINISESISPLEISLNDSRYYTVHTKLLAVVLAKLDLCIRQLHACIPTGEITKSKYNKEKMRLVGKVRGILLSPNNYKNEHVTRADILKMTDRGKEAIKKRGTIPIPILKNVQHSTFGPVSENL